MKQVEEVFAAVRLDKTTGQEFIDLASVRSDADNARSAAREVRRSATWLEANPIKRVGKFEIREVRP